MTDEVIATGYLRLITTTEGIQGALTGQFTGAGTSASLGFGKAFLGGLKGLLAVAGGVLLAREVKQFVDDGVAALSRIETITAQTNSVIQSTGGVANVSAEGVNRLADALENATASESETIREGANLLLTFKNIRNEAGAGNDVFNQTVAAMVDVGRAMGTDASGAAIQLGKALNDPVKGIAALTRMGIQFTAEQKELIKALVESGDLLGAQKIILGELNSQFGGSGAAYAETYAGKLYLVQDASGDLQEALVGGLMPTFKGFLDLALDVLNRVSQSPSFGRILERVNEVGEAGTEKLGLFVDLLERLWETNEGITAGGVVDGLKEILPQLEPLLSMAESLAPIFPEIREGLTGIVEALKDQGVTESIVELVTTVLPPLVDLLVAIAPLIPPIALLLTSVLVPALQTVTPILDLLSTGLEGLTVLLNGNSEDFTAWAGNAAAAGGIFADVLSGVGTFIANTLNVAIDALNRLGDGVESFVNGVSKALNLGDSINIPDIARLSMPSVKYGYARTGSATIPMLEDGGDITRAGWAIVGEAGAELLNLPAGAQVRPLDNPPSRGRGDIHLEQTVVVGDRDPRIAGRQFGREFANEIAGE